MLSTLGVVTACLEELPAWGMCQVTLAFRASQAANSSQAGRSTPRASSQGSQVDSALPLSAISQAGNPQASQGDSTPSKAESAVSQTGIFLASPADSTLSQAESAISQGGNTQSSQAESSQSSLADSTLPQAESKIS